MGSDSDFSGQKRSAEEALDKANDDPEYRPRLRARRTVQYADGHGAEDYSDHRGTGSGSARQHHSEAATDGTTKRPAPANVPFSGPGITRISTSTLSSIVQELNTLSLRLHSRALAYQHETAAILAEITHLQTLYNTWVQDVLVKDLEKANDGSSGVRMQGATSRVQEAVAKMKDTLNGRPQLTFNPKQQFPWDPNPHLINELSAMFGLPMTGKNQGPGVGRAEMPPPPARRNDTDGYNPRNADPLQYQPHNQQPMPMHQSISSWHPQANLSPRIEPHSGFNIQLEQQTFGNPSGAMAVRSQQQMQGPPGMPVSPRQPQQGMGTVKQSIIKALSQSMHPGSGGAAFQHPNPPPAREQQGPSAAAPQMHATDIATALATIISSSQDAAQTNAPQQQQRDAPNQTNAEGESNADFARMLLEMASNMRNNR